MIYLYFLAVWGLALLGAWHHFDLQKQPHISRKKRFKYGLLNELQLWSYAVPFRWFVDDDDAPESEQTWKLKHALDVTKLNRFFTVRSYMTLKVTLLFVSLFAGLTVVLMMKYWHIVSGYVFGVESENTPFSYQTVSLVFAVSFAVALLPNVILKQWVKRASRENVQDIPVMQLFIILQLRAGKTVVEMLEDLTRLETVHQDIFKRALLLYARKPELAMSTLRDHFQDTRFAETFSLLEDLADYYRQDCIELLERSQDMLVEEINIVKRRNDLSRLLYSQASMIIPFAAIIVLGAVPVIVMGLHQIQLINGGSVLP